MTTRQNIPQTGRYQFGVFEADLGSGELRRSGVRVRIQSQPFKVLATLIEQPGVVVSREELQFRIWGEETKVDFDHGLGIAVNKLREALGDSAENPRFVETLARRGYRFLAPVQAIPEPAWAGTANSTWATGSSINQQVQQLEQHERSITAEAHASNPAQLRRFSWLRMSAVLGTMILLALILLSLWLKPVTRKPYSVTQVTFSNRVLTNELELQNVSAPVADSSRVYFINMEHGTPTLAEALIANGEMTTLSLPPALASPLILSISHDGSALLVLNHQLPNAEEPIWIVETLGGDARRVPNILGHDAIWMPDGKHLLVASGTFLEELSADGSEIHRVATLPGSAFWLRWSPDGKKLRLTVRNFEARTTALWEISKGFQHAVPLLPNWSTPNSECCGSWTADGADYVFESMHSGHTDLWKMEESPWYLGKREPQQITGGPLDSEAPVGATQGHRIFFVGDHPQIELLEADARGSEFTTPPVGLAAAAFTAFSRDGQWVAWLNAADGSLWRSRIDGSERIELIPPPTRVFNMQWSPNNHQLAVMAEQPGSPWKVFVIDADGGPLQPLLQEAANEADPTWSPDGKSIVFGRLPDRMDSERQTKAIYEIDVATKRLHQLPGSEGLFSPRVSPDGRSILAVRLDQRALLLFDRQSQTWKTLSTHGVGDPTWSHDSRMIYFQDFLEPGKPIYKIDIATRSPRRVSSVDNLPALPVIDYRLITLAPGDRPVVSARTSTVNIYSINLD